MNLVSILIQVAILAGVAFSQCPHQETLDKLSEIADDFEKSTVVRINTATLLDVEELDVDQIIVEGSGSLVFNRGHSITIKTKGITVKDNAALVIGSQECPHEDQVNIYLEGTRTEDRDSIGPEGEKFIFVTGNGALQIFGQEKLAWTKLFSTAERFDIDSSKVKFRHVNSELEPYMNETIGLAVSVFNSSLDRSFYGVFNYFQSKIKGANKIIDRTIAATSGLQAGDVVMVTVSNKFKVTEGANITKLYSFFENAAGIPEGDLALRNSGLFDAWSLVYVYEGDNYDQAFHRQIGTKWTRATASISYKGYKMSAVSVNRVNRKDMSYVDALIIDPSVGYPAISVLDDVTSWNIGDEVLLTSTDYDWNHAEVRKILRKNDDTNTLVLDQELYYRHFGEIENRVDMRGEVALLTRNIKIQGVMSYECPQSNGKFCNIGFDTYGGHIKIHESFGTVHIEGVELEFMGQTSDKGHYPIHFHMCKNITGKTAMVRNNAIHNTFLRAITVHGTYGTSETALGVQLTNNVAYDVLGHAFFLEDGAEMATLLQGNLGASIKNVDSGFVTDKKVAIFWITNPKVIMLGNVAAGSMAMGIWYTFPREPVGLSKELKVYQFKEAKHTQLWRFDNNVVHSNAKNGMFFDNILDNEDGKVIGCMEYRPLEDPLDLNSAPAKSRLVRLTAYKNKLVNTWLRGGYFEIMQYSSAESRRGIHIARGSRQQMFVKKSVIIGRSEGNSEEDDYPGALKGKDLGQYIGAVIHDGPTYYESCWFQGFKPTEDYVAGAVGFSVLNKFTSSVVSNMTDLRFGFEDSVGGNRIYDGNVDTSVEGIGAFDSAETATLRDADGSISGCPGAEGFKWEFPTQLVTPEKYILTEDCVYRENWNMAACNNKYGKIKINPKAVFGEGSAMDFDKAGQMRRVPINNALDTAVEDRKKQKTTEYMVLLGRDEYYYQFQFTNDFPKSFRIEGRGLERDYGVTVGVCLPENATLGEDYVIVPKDGNDNFVPTDDQELVTSLQEVIEDKTMSKFYKDGRFMYFKLHTNRPRDGNWDHHDTDHCAARNCPQYAIHFNKQMDFVPCFTPTDEEMSNTEIMEQIEEHDCILPASDPDADWGAGDTTVESRDGNWGEWSSWADCCYQAGETATTTRFRFCDNPPQFGNGQDCVGSAEETGTCQTPCPVDGVLSDWSRWSECFCDGLASGTYGLRTRSKSCDGTANGGKACSGNIEDMKACYGDCGYYPDNE